jgi:amidohydrolase
MTSTAVPIAELAAQLRAGLAAELDAAVALRHDLHAEAEPSGSEHRTAARVAAALGAPDAPAVAGTGRLIRIGPDGPCVALRAELDALPIAEQTGVAWASRTGAMHACGHDVHLAALTAVCRVATAAATAGSLPMAVLAVLQPREESIPSGARDLAESGALEAELPSAIVAVHLQHQLPRGTVAAASGTVNAATDDIEIRVEGTGGHAGYPQLAVDPVVALCQTVLALQHAVSRRSDPTRAVVVSIGMLEAGQAANVIPATAVARGTLRVLDESDRAGLRQMAREIAEHTCLAHGCRAHVTIDEGEPALTNDEALTVSARPWLREAGFSVDTSFRSCGADDFSYYTRGGRALMLFLGTGGPHALHHPSFLPDDEMVGETASVLLAGYLGAVSLAQSRSSLAPGGQDV